MTLSTKKLHWGFNSIQFVGHKLDSTGINMTQKRIEGTTQQFNRTILVLGIGKLLSGSHSPAFCSGPAITRHGQGGR